MPHKLSPEEFEEYGSDGQQSTTVSESQTPKDGKGALAPAAAETARKKEYPWSVDLPIALAPAPTNPGSRDHPNCNPCSFVFRLAGDYVRLRCANAETCAFCHHASHPRNRPRKSRRKSERGSRRERQVDQGEQQDDDAGDAYIPVMLPDKISTLDLSGSYLGKPVNDECRLLLEWASEFKPCGTASCGKETRAMPFCGAFTDGDEKRPTGSSKEFWSSTTVASVRDW
jgi:hypothetical protein